MTAPTRNSPEDTTPDAESPTVEQITRLLETFARTRDPSVMWPGVSESERVAAVQEIERVTRRVLEGAPGVALDPSSQHSPRALAVAGHTTGMAPVVGDWIERGLVHAEPERAGRFARYLAHSRLRAAHVARELRPALDAFASKGITPVVLKGFHTAHAYFAEPGLRRMADVDLLVAPEHVSAAEAVLATLGYRPGDGVDRPYKRDWRGPNVDGRIHSLELPDARNPWGIELHSSLDRVYHPGAVARLDGERGLVEWQSFGDRSLLVPRPALLLLLLACHCSQELDGSRLLRVYEMIRVIRAERDTGRLDWEEFRALLQRTRTARFSYPALALAEELSPGTVDPLVLRAGRRDSTWAARHTVDRLAPAGASLDQRGVIRQVMWIRGPLAVAQRVLRLLWPAGFTRPADVPAGWRARLRRLRNGLMSWHAPDERSAGRPSTEVPPPPRPSRRTEKER